LLELREWCANSGHKIIHEYVEHVSGKNGTDKRPAFAELFKDAHKRKFDMVLSWALDRFSREGMAEAVMHLKRLTSYGVSFHSYTEPLISTDNDMVRDIIIAVMAALAKQESQRRSERTKAGMARVSSKGKHVGRPALDRELQEQISVRISNGATVYRVAKELGLDKNTVAKYAVSE
jgi:DNA invertase Pin-like site-specific DNA recombinase